MSYSSKLKNQDTNNTTNATLFNTNTTSNINDIDNKSKEQEFIDEYNYKKKLKEDKQNRYKHTIEKTYNVSTNNTILDTVENIPIIVYNPNFCIQPRHINIYNKKYCMKWLTYKIDDNYYHYDYCVKLFELLMKWVRYNNFGLKTNERALLGKFISLMYLLSNKKDYYYNK